MKQKNKKKILKKGNSYYYGRKIKTLDKIENVA